MKAKKIVFVKLTPILLAFIGVTNAHGPSTKKISLCQGTNVCLIVKNNYFKIFVKTINSNLLLKTLAIHGVFFLDFTLFFAVNHRIMFNNISIGSIRTRVIFGQS